MEDIIVTNILIQRHSNWFSAFSRYVENEFNNSLEIIFFQRQNDCPYISDFGNLISFFIFIMSEIFWIKKFMLIILFRPSILPYESMTLNIFNIFVQIFSLNLF